MTHVRRPTPRQIVEGLLHAYSVGAFPMAYGGGPKRRGHIEWYSPDPRALMPLSEAEGLHVPAIVDRTLRRGAFTLRADTAFTDVMLGCAGPRKRKHGEPPGTWIDRTILEWYALLFQAGHAHSLEAWRTDPVTGQDHLVGGIYGVSIGAAFFGESMFHRARPRPRGGPRDPLDGTGASSACLIALTRHLAACGYTLFDVQFTNEHIARFGVREIPRDDYMSRLKHALAQPDRWKGFPATSARAPG